MVYKSPGTNYKKLLLDIIKKSGTKHTHNDSNMNK